MGNKKNRAISMRGFFPSVFGHLRTDYRPSGFKTKVLSIGSCGRWTPMPTVPSFPFSVHLGNISTLALSMPLSMTTVVIRLSRTVEGNGQDEGGDIGRHRGALDAFTKKLASGAFFFFVGFFFHIALLTLLEKRPGERTLKNGPPGAQRRFPTAYLLMRIRIQAGRRKPPQTLYL